MFALRIALFQRRVGGLGGLSPFAHSPFSGSAERQDHLYGPQNGHDTLGQGSNLLHRKR